MTKIDYFAWAVFIIIILTVVVVFIALAQLPKKIAIKNNHPHVDAVNIASWLGMIMTFGIVWIFAMVWASMSQAGSSNVNINSDLETSKDDKEKNK